MSAPAQAAPPQAEGSLPRCQPYEHEVGLVALLFTLAAFGWWWTADQMQGMDNGPWTGLGTFGWFLTVWVVMMAAMMFPSVAPTRGAVLPYDQAALSAVAPHVHVRLPLRLGRRRGARLRDRSGDHIDVGDFLAWDGAGRWAAGGTLVVAAVYELTPMKDVCLAKCRSPLGFLLGSWRDGWSGASRWEPRTVHGASAVVGPSWHHSLH